MGSRSLRSAVWRGIFMLLLWCGAASAAAQPADRADGPAPEVWLVTVEPGAAYWQRFGHNTILVRKAPGADSVSFNFGYFDFAQEDFLLRFLRGRMLYQAVALEGERDIGGYLEEGRRVWLQRLALDGNQARRLVEHLEEHVRPANREYRYDYFVNNCSSKLRDALDLALGGQFKRATEHRSHGLSYRHFARAYARSLPWLYLGIDLGLGQRTDRPLSLWEEAFIPGELKRLVRELKDARGQPLVVEERMLPAGASTLEDSPEAPQWMPLVAAMGLFVAGTIITLGRFAQRSAAARVSVALVGGVCALLFAFVGVGLAGFWVATDHTSAWRNENLLLFSPLWLLTLPAWWSLLRDRPPTVRVFRIAKFALNFALASALFALASKVLRSFNQDNFEWILLLLPIVAALGQVLLRAGRSRSDRAPHSVR